MTREGGETVRHVPSETCPQCGEQAEPNRFQYVLKDSDPERNETLIESGNTCEDCFDELFTVVPHRGKQRIIDVI